MENLGYEIDLKELCKNQRFRPKEVVSSDLVFPKGAVPNAQILWVRVELTNGERKFITLPLRDFYQYIELPESSIGGWTEGKLGTDKTNQAHLAKYAIDGNDRPDISGPDPRNEDNDRGGQVPLRDDLLDRSEGPA